MKLFLTGLTVALGLTATGLANDEPLCPDTLAADVCAEAQLLPHSSDQLILPSEINDWLPDRLRIARNEIFARHGYQFEDDSLASWFEARDWYEAADGRIELNETEASNVRLIQMVEESWPRTENMVTDLLDQSQASWTAGVFYGHHHSVNRATGWGRRIRIDHLRDESHEGHNGAGNYSVYNAGEGLSFFVNLQEGYGTIRAEEYYPPILAPDFLARLNVQIVGQRREAFEGETVTVYELEGAGVPVLLDGQLPIAYFDEVSVGLFEPGNLPPGAGWAIHGSDWLFQPRLEDGELWLTGDGIPVRINGFWQYLMPNNSRGGEPQTELDIFSSYRSFTLENLERVDPDPQLFEPDEEAIEFWAAPG